MPKTKKGHSLSGTAPLISNLSAFQLFQYLINCKRSLEDSGHRMTKILEAVAQNIYRIVYH